MEKEVLEERQAFDKKEVLQKVQKCLNEIFIDGLSGMALGLFSTLIIGTILAQAGSLMGGGLGESSAMWQRP